MVAVAMVGVSAVTGGAASAAQGAGAGAGSPAQGASLTSAARLLSPEGHHAAQAAVGAAPAVPVGATVLGPAGTSQPLALDVVLKPRAAAALAARARAVSTPGSATYRHFLTTAQFAAAYAPTAATVGAVDAALRSSGLQPGARSANGLVIPVTTTVGQAERALHTSIERVLVPGGRVAVANTAAPELPGAVAGAVQAVIGLDTVPTAPGPPPAVPAHATRPGAQATPAASGPTACSAAVSAGQSTGGWTENQLAQAYSIKGLYSKGQLGANTTIALFELDPYQASDIATFQSCYKTAVKITPVNVDGGDGTGAGEGEATLDIETAIGLAPKASLRVYEAPSASYAKSTLDEYNAIITDNKAQIISSSYGLCEPVVNRIAPGLVQSENTLFQEAANQGISTFVASGDTGSSECYPNGGVEALPTGASSKPDAVAVDPTYHTAYVSDLGTGDVTIVDDQAESVVGTLKLGSSTDPSAIAVDPKSHKLFIGLAGTDALVELSTATCNAEKTSNCSTTSKVLGSGLNDLEGVAVNPTTATVYAALQAAGKVDAVAESGLTVAGAESTGGTDPYAVAVDSTSDIVWVTNSKTNTVARINGATCNAKTTSGCSAKPPVTTVGTTPISVAVDHAAGEAFVIGYADDSLSVVVSSTGKRIDDFALSPFASGPADVALSPDGAHLLIPANFAGAATVEPGILVITPAGGITGILDDGGSQPYSVASDSADSVVTEADPGDSAAVFLPLELAVDDPSSQPFVTSVGGTDLTALGPAPTESTWNEAFNPNCGCQEGAGTGGISSDWPMPSWQTGPGVSNAYSSGVPCGASSGDCREVPDVSASADPTHGYVVYHAGGWTSIGGTSAATPLWAAMLAVIESKNATPVRQGFLDPRLYSTAAAHSSSVFNDVTVGTNDYVGIHDGAYPATARYDQATGLGSPIATGLESLLPAP